MIGLLFFPADLTCSHATFSAHQHCQPLAQTYAATVHCLYAQHLNISVFQAAQIIWILKPTLDLHLLTCLEITATQTTAIVGSSRIARVYGELYIGRTALRYAESAN